MPNNGAEDLCTWSPATPGIGVVNMRLGSFAKLRHRCILWRYPTRLAMRHSRQSVAWQPRLPASTSLRSLRSRPVTALHRYYGRSDSCPPGSSALPSMNTGSCYEQVSLIHAPDLPIPPPPTTSSPSTSLSHATPQLVESPVFHGSRLHQPLAGSLALVRRIGFVILQMDRSPPAASHPASLRRSCSRLQTGERLSGEDFHLSGQCALSGAPGAGPVPARWPGETSRKPCLTIYAHTAVAPVRFHVR